MMAWPPSQKTVQDPLSLVEDGGTFVLEVGVVEEAA
jgi:hypothetical protein